MHEEQVATGDLPLLEPELDTQPEVEETISDEYDEFGDSDREGPPESPPEEPYNEPEPEPAPVETVATDVVESSPDESSPAGAGADGDDGELPAFYRPRPRTVPKMPEPAKED